LIYPLIPQGAAFEAERVFLAAIDKFDAMLLKGNVYAPDGIMSIFLNLSFMIFTYNCN